MEISATLVKELREKTGAGMMDCKKALAETSGDFDKAIEYLRKKGVASAAKKAGRATKEGTVASFIQDNGKVGVLVEVNCETDFVARTEQFKAFVQDVGAQIGKGKASTVEGLMAQTSPREAAKTMEVLLKETIATLGENMSVRRFSRFETSGDGKGVVGSYIHGEGKVGVLLEVAVGNPAVAQNDAFRTFLKDVSMHIAAASPQYVNASEIPADIVAKEKEIAIAQMASQNKPAAVLEKIAEGKIKKFYEDVCLVNQAFVKDPDKTVDQLTQATAKVLGQDLSIRRFARYTLGEGMKESTEAAH